MSAASDRLASFYNGLAYNASTNAGGLAQGGHRVNFTPALQDVATVAGEIASSATAAATSATNAATSETNAAASASKLQGTSTTSVSIGSGSKTFTTQASKFYTAGTYVNVRSAANPTVNYMAGQVTSYSGTTLVVNMTATGGSGSFADWNIDIAGSPGQTGNTGNTGAIGPSPAIQFNFSTGITDVDPGNGLFKFDNATFAAVQWVYFDNLNKDSIDVQNWLDSLDDSTTSANRGRLYFMQPTAPTKVAYFKVIGAVLDGTGYRKVPVSPIICSSASIPFDSAAAVAIDFSPSGDSGLNGSGAGDVVGPASATDSAIALFNTTTGKLLKNSGNGIGTSGANVGLLNGNNTHSGTASFTGTFAWSSTSIGTVASANALTVGPSGSTNPTLKVDTSTASAATGLQIKSAAAAAGLALSVLSSGTDEALKIDAKGAGTITLGGTSTGSVVISRALTYGGVALSNAVTGTGNMVLSASPTLTGTITAVAANFSGVVSVTAATAALAVNATAASLTQTATFLNASMANDNKLYVTAGTAASSNNAFIWGYNHNSTAASRYFFLNAFEAGIGTHFKLDASGTLTLGASTASSSPTSGALVVTGGVGVGGAVVASGIILSASSFNSTIVPTTGPAFTVENQAGITVANGASSAILSVGAAGLVVINNGVFNVAVYAITAGLVGATMIYGDGGWVAATTTPAAGKCSFSYDGSTGCRIYNNLGSTHTFHVLNGRTN